MPKALDRRRVRKTLHSYRVVNEITEAEKRAWLGHVSFEEAHKIFDDLHQNADDWKRNGGNLEALEKRRLASKFKGRKIFLRLAQKGGRL